MTTGNLLFYGDNLDVLRKHIPRQSVDLCYIDPPFHSQRAYNQIYNNAGQEDLAPAQAFTDMWRWDERAAAGYGEIVTNADGRFTPQLAALIQGLRAVLREGSLLAYLVSLALRITEIFRVLTSAGSLYLHCDSTASHYLKLILDAVFCSQGGGYKNEIIWKRAETVKGNVGQGSRRFDPNTDTVFFYTKSGTNTFNPLFARYDDQKVQEFYKFVEPETGRRYQLISMTAPGDAAKGNPSYEVMGVRRYWRFSKEKMQTLIDRGLVVQTSPGNVPRKKQYLDEGKGVPIQTLWADLPALHSQSGERLGYPAQKPLSLLERIICASSNPGDTVLDAYCGCGTTIVAAHKLQRKWIGIDITYQAISAVLKRLEDTFGKQITGAIALHGVPKDLESAAALARSQDVRLSQEFEKWAALTYTNNRAIIRQKEGAACFHVATGDGAKIVFQVHSGPVEKEQVAALRGDMENEAATSGVLITLEEPETAKNYDRITFVTIREILEQARRL